MGYNNGLAVGLSVGIPCFLILVLCLAFWIRNRRRQRTEDNMEQDIDVELRDDNSFNRFEDALHKHANTYDKKEGSDVTAHEKQVSLTDLEVHDDKISLSRGSSTSNTFSEPKKANFFTPPPSVLNGNSARYVPHLNPGSLPGLPGFHQKTPSSYDVYDTFIPILPSRNSTANDLSDLTQPPPALNTDGKSSVSSSNTSLIGLGGGPVTATGANRENNRLLDNLAKQLHQLQLFDKLPSRAATVSLKHRPVTQIPNNSSAELVKDYFQNNAINESYVVQVPYVADDEEEETGPRQKHIYFQRLNGTTEDKKTQANEALEEIDTPQLELGPQPKDDVETETRPPVAHSGIGNIESNFDNNIATDRFDADEPDVVFK